MAKQNNQNTAAASAGGAAPPDTHKLELRLWAFTLWFPLALLGVLTLAMFADVLFFPRGRVLSVFGYDLFREFLPWRNFGVRELSSGNFPLWNPHSFCGTPFFGGFQSALLYPLNLLFLLLPLGLAFNWSIALHVYLAGAFTYLWVRNRGLHPLACFLSATMFMFSGPYFLHIFPGHISNLCTMIWAPLLFLAIDRIITRPSLGPGLLGSFAAAMAILAGHIQYVFYLAVAAGIYSILNLVSGVRPSPGAAMWKLGSAQETSGALEHRGVAAPGDGRTPTLNGYAFRVILCLGLLCLGAIGLTAVQLFTGLQEAGETLRSGKVSYDFASIFSFPPENFLTLIAPWFFGDMKGAPYWGRCYLHEMSLFVSVTGLVLAIYGALRGERRLRRFSTALVLLSLLLALGTHTPLFDFLYYYVPGFDKFRGSAKFIFVAGLFLTMLAGIGLDRLVKQERVPRTLTLGTLAAGLIVCGFTLWLSHATMTTAPDDWWPSLVRTIQRTGEIFFQGDLAPGTFDDPRFPLQAGGIACQSLLLGGGAFLVLSLLLFLANRSRRWLFAIAGLAVLELLAFARSSLDTFPLTRAIYPEVRQVLHQNPGDYRILNWCNPNSAMTTGALDLWGEDPGVLRRSAQFLAFSQGIAPGDVRQFIPITNVPPVFAMLRCRFLFPAGSAGTSFYETTTPPLPRLLLLDRCRVLTNQHEILSALTNTAFNPRAEVILESQPDPWPQLATNIGTVKLLDSSTDRFTVEADLKSPAILLVTDSYSRHWHVRPLDPAPQSRYQVLPANYCLQAIPLAAGRHHFSVEYAPLGFRIGKWVSLASLAVFLGLCLTRSSRRGGAQINAIDTKDGARPAKQGTVAADVSRRTTQPQPGSAPTDVGGYDSLKAPLTRGTSPLLARTARSVSPWTGMALIFALVFLAYLPAIRGDFIWDDDTMLTGNALVKSAAGLSDIWFSTKASDYVPLTLTSFWFEWRLWGGNPIGYHLLNILLQAAAAVLVWRVLERLWVRGAWLAAAIFALHPVCVASVAWITERKNTLSLVFYLLSLLWYLRYDSESRNTSTLRSAVHPPQCYGGRATEDGQHATRPSYPSSFILHPSSFYLLSLLAFFLALASKPSVVILPLVLLLCAWWCQGRITWRDLWRTAPFFLLSFASAAMAVWIQHRARAGGAVHSDPLLARLVAGSWAVWFYLSKALLPINLSMIYPRWAVNPRAWLSYAPTLLLAALLAGLWLNRKQWPRPALFALGYFLLTLLPVLGLFDLYFFVYSQVADHWQYLGLIGIAALGAAGGAVAADKLALAPRARAGCAAGLLAALFLLTWSRASTYSTAEALWGDTLRKNPRAWAACNNLANVLDERGQSAQALNLYQEALELNPAYPEAHNNLGALYAKMGKAADALAQYSEALRLNPSFAEAHNNLATLLLDLGKLDQARAHLTEALRLQPDYADAHYNLGNLLLKDGKPADAFQQYVTATRLHPYFAQAYYNAGNIRAAQSNYLDAARFFAKAAEIAPAFADAHFNLGLALQRLGRSQEADLHLRAALRLNPGLAPPTNQVESLPR